jgi:long-chain acyl-CoA synthetase
MLSHGAILSNCKGAYHLLLDLGLEDEVFLSFLPLSHSYEHTAGLMFPVSIGAQIYFADGVDRLTTNMAEARPTIMTAVPRLYESMHARMTKTARQAGGLKERLFQAAVALGRKRYEGGGLDLGERIADAALDRLVRAKVKRQLGGRLKALVSGGAPLNPDIGKFFLALGLRVLQGYGQTESAPIVSCNPPRRVRIETVGPPVVDVDVRIADDGELLVKGELVMQGYWNDPAATDEALRDGWLHTGDIGEIDPDGYIRITDRKKDIIVNSGGDNIAPQRVEGFLTLQPEIGQAMVYGDRRPHLVALIVPDDDFAKEWARGRGAPPDLAALVDDPEFQQAIGAAIDRVNAGLSVLERVRRFKLVTEPFTIANELLTPSLKIRRHKIKALYGKDLEDLYWR